MQSTFLTMLLMSICVSTNAQPFKPHSELSDALDFDVCEKIFLKSQVMPSLKIQPASYVDSLRSYMNESGTIFPDSAIFQLLINKMGEVKRLDLIAGVDIDVAAISAAVKHHQGFWKPATNNEFKVCSYVICYLKKKDDGFNLELKQ